MMTPAQKRVLEAIISWLKEDPNIAPTYREIATRSGLHSLSTVSKHLDALEARGFILRSDERLARNIELTPKVIQYFGGCPLCGRKDDAHPVSAA